MENAIKVQIAISLFTGAVLALFVFFGTIAGNVLSERMKNFGLIFLVAFIFLMLIIIVISLIVLFNPHTTDFSFWRKIFE